MYKSIQSSLVENWTYN